LISALKAVIVKIKLKLFTQLSDCTYILYALQYWVTGRFTFHIKLPINPQGPSVRLVLSCLLFVRLYAILQVVFAKSEGLYFKERKKKLNLRIRSPRSRLSRIKHHVITNKDALNKYASTVTISISNTIHVFHLQEPLW